MQDMSLGKKIKESRLKKQITQKELAGDVITRNMLSQIENDLAMPSVKTLEYIASVLEKPVSYFLGDFRSDSKKRESHLLDDLLKFYEEKEYENCIQLIDDYFTQNPRSMNSDIFKGIYINCCIKKATELEGDEQYEEAESYYLKTLVFESDYFNIQDISLYSIYSKLSEVNIALGKLEESKKYAKIADNVINKIKMDRRLQEIYISYLSGDYERVIEELQDLSIDELTDSNKGKYFLMMGSSLYNRQKYHMSIRFLENAIEYYSNNSTIIRQVIYKELSACYSELEDYKKAYEYLQFSQKNHE